MSQHKAKITRRVARRHVTLATDRVLVSVTVRCSCRASMVRRFWFTVSTATFARAGVDGDIVTETMAPTRYGASKCPALICALRGTNAAVGEPISAELARLALGGPNNGADA